MYFYFENKLEISSQQLDTFQFDTHLLKEYHTFIIFLT